MTELKDAERTVTLDRERTLRMDFNALAKAEELTGKNFIDAATWRSLSIRDYRALIFACLVHEDPALTLESVGQMVTPRNERPVSDALMELYIGETAKPIDDAETAKAPFANAGGGGGQ
jgi:hypothetical protein